MKRIIQTDYSISDTLNDIMICNGIGSDRRNMTISVVILGMTLCVVFLAYFAFSEMNSDSDKNTIKFAAIVSIKLTRIRRIFIFI